jgi:hypothetical protein
MGTWSAEPVGNDAAADFVGDLEDERGWSVVRATLSAATEAGPEMDSDIAELALAAAEVVAHGLGRPTQDDAYTASIGQFVERAGKPDEALVGLAAQAVTAAASPDGELAELWDDAGSDDLAEWRESITRLTASLGAGR